MNVNELLGFLDVFRKAADHHDPTSPTVHDTTTLAKDGAAVAPKGGLMALLEVLLANPAIVAVVVAFLKELIAGRPMNPPAQPVMVPIPAPVPGPVVTNAPRPTSPAVGATPKLVAALEVNLDMFINEGVPANYKVDEDNPGYYQLVKTDGTDNMPIHGGAYLHAGYVDAQGRGINFEERGTPELYGTAVWTAREIGGQGRVSVLAPSVIGDKQTYVQNDGPNGRIVNWNNEAELPKEARRTGGMDVPVHFPPEANEAVVEITLSVGDLKAKPIRFPKVS